MEIFLKYIMPPLSLIIVFGIPFVYVFLTGRYGKGVLMVWFLMIAWYTILSQPVYEILRRTHQDLCYEYMPEGNTIIASIFTGWIAGAVISVLAYSLRKMILKIKPSLLERRRYNEED